MVIHIRSTGFVYEERAMSQAEIATATFEVHRARLLRIAYRMLGSRSEAEDVVQNAWLRWVAVDQTKVSAPYPFLARIVTRLCLDEMKSARARRRPTSALGCPIHSSRTRRMGWTKMT